MLCSECSIPLRDAIAEELGMPATVSPTLFTSHGILEQVMMLHTATILKKKS
jgi:hypothetical protein